MRWLLALPRLLELIVLGLAFVALSVVGFVAGLFRRRTRDPALRRPRRWTGRRIFRVVVGGVLIVAGLALVPAGAVGLWLDQTGRDESGFVGTSLKRFSSAGYAISTEPGALRFDGPPWLVNRLVGEIRVTGVGATATPLFLGIASTRDQAVYLAPVEHTIVHRLDRNTPEPVSGERVGQVPPELPGTRWIWVAQAAGTGVQTIDWAPRPGNWSVVVLNADGSRAVQADLAVAATVPWLDDLAVSLMGLGALCLLAGTLLISLTTRAVRRQVATG
ncbi:hypothetical protein [Kribbella amoyensis]|uniref:hypothetical protein n=1 Tax=Kribbella amoyensis TaxID=996641 RepID=UPI0011A2CC8D|nr:hypothetical protein [Kribbella amoyensis]